MIARNAAAPGPTPTSRFARTTSFRSPPGRAVTLAPRRGGAASASVNCGFRRRGSCGTSGRATRPLSIHPFRSRADPPACTREADGRPGPPESRFVPACGRWASASRTSPTTRDSSKVGSRRSDRPRQFYCHQRRDRRSGADRVVAERDCLAVEKSLARAPVPEDEEARHFARDALRGAWPGKLLSIGWSNGCRRGLAYVRNMRRHGYVAAATAW